MCTPLALAALAALATGLLLEFEGSLMFQAWKLEQEQLRKEEEEEEKAKKMKSEPKGKQQGAVKPADAKKGSSSSAGQKKGAGNAEKVPEPEEERAEAHPEEVTFGVTHVLHPGAALTSGFACRRSWA